MPQDKQDIERLLRAYYAGDGSDEAMQRLLLDLGFDDPDSEKLIAAAVRRNDGKDLDMMATPLRTAMYLIVQDVWERQEAKEHNRLVTSLDNVATITKDGKLIAEIIRPRTPSGGGLVLEHPNVISEEDSEKAAVFSGDPYFGNISHAMHMRRPGVNIPETVADFDFEKDNGYTQDMDKEGVLDDFNEYLETDTGVLTRAIEDIKSIMQPIHEDRPMFRKVAEPADYEPGDIVTTQSFASTTLLPEYAVDWSRWMKNSNQVVWEIRSGGRPFDAIVTRNANEEDIIIDADIPLKVLEVHKQVLFTPSEVGAALGGTMDDAGKPLVIDYVVMEIQPKQSKSNAGEINREALYDEVEKYQASKQNESVERKNNRHLNRQETRPMQATARSRMKGGRGQIGR